MKAKNLIGLKFNRLTVIKQIENHKNRRQWECLCDCGKITKVLSENLTKSKVKSCGCLRNEIAAERLKRIERKILPKGEGSLSCLLNSYRYQAKRRGFSFNLDKDEFRILTSSNCKYCGTKPNNQIKGHRSNGSYTYNGVDRVDTTKGYSLDNCVTCCEICNKAKGILSLEEFKLWIKRLINFNSDINHI